MKTTLIPGAMLKQGNGSGYNLAGAFPSRRFHDRTIYLVTFNGVNPDRSNVISISRARNGWNTGLSKESARRVKENHLTTLARIARY